MKQSNKIVLFPKWKEGLKKSSFKLLKEKKYGEALDVFNQLLKHGELNHNIIFGKLLCLAELERLSEAIEILERLIFTDGNKRHEYVHMYVTLLYQMNKYTKLIDVVERISEIEQYPQQYLIPIKQLYQLSESAQQANNNQLIQEKTKRFLKIIGSDQHAEQRQIIFLFKNLKVYPKDDFIEVLALKDVHPVIKTDLLMWFLSKNVTSLFHIEKFDQRLSISAKALKPIKEQAIFNEVLSCLYDIENNDPVTFSHIKEVFRRFLYVWYPLPLDNYRAEDIARALKSIGQTSLLKDNQSNQIDIKELIDIISFCDALYLSVTGG